MLNSTIRLFTYRKLNYFILTKELQKIAFNNASFSGRTPNTQHLQRAETDFHRGFALVLIYISLSTNFLHIRYN